jgi:hypothetical protein
MRREATRITKQLERYHNIIGESVIWFCFDVVNSTYDHVYDEGYRRYERGRKVPVLWIDQQEAAEDYAPEGRRPTQRLRFAVASRQMYESGIRIDEAHGQRIYDQPPSDTWREDRLNDIVYYGGRFFEISGFQIRGRVQEQDLIIGVSGIETQPTDELNLDIVPLSWFPPPAETPDPPTNLILPDAYEGDPYSWTITFPDASYLAGSPADVDAEIKVHADQVVPDAEWVKTVNGAVLLLSLLPVTLAPGAYWTDVSIAGITYVRKTRFIVREQVSV